MCACGPGGHRCGVNLVPLVLTLFHPGEGIFMSIQSAPYLRLADQRPSGFFMGEQKCRTSCCRWYQQVKKETTYIRCSNAQRLTPVCSFHPTINRRAYVTKPGEPGSRGLQLLL